MNWKDFFNILLKNNQTLKDIAIGMKITESELYLLFSNDDLLTNKIINEIAAVTYMTDKQINAIFFAQ